MAKKEGETKMLGTKEMAAKLKVKPAFLRRVLRKTGKNDGEYTRYKWPEGDSAAVSKIESAIEKYSADEKEKPKKTAKTKKAKAKPAKKEEELVEVA